MTPKYFTSFENSHIEPLMKMSDKPHCLLTEDLKNMQTDFLALNVVVVVVVVCPQCERGMS